MKSIAVRIILISLGVISLLAMWITEPKIHNSTAIREFLLENHKYIAFVSDRDGDPEIYLTSIDGMHQVNLTNHSAWDISPTFSPDGQHIAFTSNREASEKGPSDIYIMNVDGTNVTRLTNNSPHSSLFPAWSPDGERIAFVTNSYIAIINIDGTDQTVITKVLSYHPAWSPDGQYLAFAASYFNENRKYESGYNSDYEISSMNIDEKKLIRLTFDDGCWDSHPAWSPNGEWIVFSACGLMREGKLFMVQVDGTNLTSLTSSGEEIMGTWPNWSPDGEHIAFSSKGKLYLINIDGTELIHLTSNNVTGCCPVWSP